MGIRIQFHVLTETNCVGWPGESVKWTNLIFLYPPLGQFFPRNASSTYPLSPWWPLVTGLPFPWQ